MRRVTVLLLLAAVLASCDTVGTTEDTPTRQDQVDQADFRGYGPYRIGMSTDEVREAAGNNLEEASAIQDAKCHSFHDPRRRDGGLLIVLINGVVVGISPPRYTSTTRGVTFGQDKGAVARAYADETVTEQYSQAGLEILVEGDKSDSYLGFSVDDDSQAVTEVRVGTYGFAANHEICVAG